MTVEEMRKRKRELGYSFKLLSELSGVPLGTVQKVFNGETKNPRYQTIQALERVLSADAQSAGRSEHSLDEYYRQYHPVNVNGNDCVREAEAAYYAASAPEPEHADTDNTGYRIREDGFLEGPYTYADYMKLPDDQRVELIYGVFYDLASPKYGHQKIQSNLMHQLLSQIEQKGMNCDVVGSMDSRVEKDDKTVVQPDISVLSHPDENRLRDERIWGAPDFVIEILSPSTRSRDMSQKLKLYRESGVREYWMVDPREQLLFQIVFEKKEVLQVRTLEGWTDVGISDGEIRIDLNQIRKILQQT